MVQQIDSWQILAGPEPADDPERILNPFSAEQLPSFHGAILHDRPGSARSFRYSCGYVCFRRILHMLHSAVDCASEPEALGNIDSVGFPLPKEWERGCLWEC